jgi:hypothetical protein
MHDHADEVGSGAGSERRVVLSAREIHGYLM